MEADKLEVCSISQLVVKQIEDSYEARGEKNDPLPQKGMRTAQKVCTGSGPTCPKNGEFMGRRPGQASNSATRRLGQTGTGRAPHGTFSKRQ